MRNVLQRCAVARAPQGATQMLMRLDVDEEVGAISVRPSSLGVAKGPSRFGETRVRRESELFSELGIARERGHDRAQILHVETRMAPSSISFRQLEPHRAPNVADRASCKETERRATRG